MTEGIYTIEIKAVKIRDALSSELKNSKDIISILLEDFNTKDREYFIRYDLNGKNKVTSKEIISIGTLDTSIISPREIFKGAILQNAGSIILAHNHPSGSTIPSNEDLRTIGQIIKAGKILGIEVIDVFIVTDKEAVSFIDKFEE